MGDTLMYIITALAIIFVYRWRFANLYGIPAIGPSLPVLSWLGAVRLVLHGRDMLQEGYQKYKGGTFKVAMPDRWIVFVSGETMEEVRKMPDEQMSFFGAIQDMLQVEYTFGHEVAKDPFHHELIRNQLTRNLTNLFPDVHDEITVAFNDLIPMSTTDEWTTVNAFPIMQRIIARVTSRVFVGLPLCRYDPYVDLATRHTLEITKIRAMLTFFPRPLKPIALKLFNKTHGNLQLAKQYLGPTIEERLSKMRKYGNDWTDRPRDMLQWVIEEATSKGGGIEGIVQIILATNFAAIHTTSNSLTHALYQLAANPQYVKPLRDEIESVLKEEGWSKNAMNKMRKLDSFIRESQRVHGISGISFLRRAVTDVTLSNGSFIPAGTILMAPSVCTHMDSENYDDPSVFKPWRFSEMREGEGESTKYQFVSTSTSYIPFGHGKHACPGRFFAANEIKGILAHTVMDYDIKFENEGVRPDNVWLSIQVLPSPTAQVLFRKRRD
ncbi:unnamed protein product [Somion occarium]|uniref:Cytochrome P450 n=1 Tax=Somion occarium TaxID=3059160 RepID=A0ABP1DSV2_9APHY